MQAPRITHKSHALRLAAKTASNPCATPATARRSSAQPPHALALARPPQAVSLLPDLLRGSYRSRTITLVPVILSEARLSPSLPSLSPFHSPPSACCSRPLRTCRGPSARWALRRRPLDCPLSCLISVRACLPVQVSGELADDHPLWSLIPAMATAPDAPTREEAARGLPEAMKAYGSR